MRIVILGVALTVAAQLRAEPVFERITVASVRQYATSAYPTLNRLADGRLLCVYSAIDDKATGGKAVIVGTFSEDNGRTWSKPLVLIDSRPDLDYDPNIVVIGPRVIVTSTTVPPTHGQFISTSRTVAVRSEDNGKTWSKPYDIPMGHRYTSGKINRGIALRDGTVLFAYSWDIALDRSEKLTSEGQEECLACLMASTDRGMTWKTISHVTTRDRKLADRAGAINGLDEPAIVDLSDGSIYMLCRTGVTKLYESRSKDGGKTWSTAVPSPLTSHNAPASLCRIDGKKPGVLAVWCNSPTNRWPLCAAASFDDCKTWSRPRRLTERDGNEQSYPACIEATDGTLVAAWQEVVAGGREVRAARFNLDWLLEDTSAATRKRLSAIRLPAPTGVQSGYGGGEDPEKTTPAWTRHAAGGAIAESKVLRLAPTGGYYIDNQPAVWDGARDKLVEIRMRVVSRDSASPGNHSAAEIWIGGPQANTGCRLFFREGAVSFDPMYASPFPVDTTQLHTYRLATDLKRSTCYLFIDDAKTPALETPLGSPEGMNINRILFGDSSVGAADVSGTSEWASVLWTDVAAAPARPRTIVLFGDSTTAPRANTRVFAEVLAERLAAGPSAARVINAGVGGNNTAQARQRFEHDVVEQEPDLVTIFFGLNDSAVDVSEGATKPRVDVDRYRENLRCFVETLRQKGARPILMTPNPVAWTDALKKMYGKPPYRTDDPDGWNVLLKDYAAAVRAVAASEDVPLVDVDRLFREYAAADGHTMHDLLSDGIHPNTLGHRMIADALMPLLVASAPAAMSAGPRPEWSAPSLPYRVLVEVPPADIDGRKSDAMPAALDVDFGAPPFTDLKLPGPVDLDSIQVIGYAPTTGKPLPAPAWPFARSPGERVSRFLDKSLPWQFPTAEPRSPGQAVGTFERGAFLTNAKGKGNPGLITWDHLQEEQTSPRYAIYFDTLRPGKRQTVPRQGFIGDGSPRRDVATGTLTGSYYNRLAVTDWDGDGLSDLLIGTGFGYVLLYRNEGDRTHAKYGAGEYVTNATGQILNIGGMASPDVADWNGDGVPDLVIGEEGTAGVFWYENKGSASDAKLVFRGRIQADGADIVIPAKPCPESPHYTKDYAPSVDVVDWNGDGRSDLLLGGYITGYVWYYENVGTNADGTPTLKFRGPLESAGKPIDTIWGAHPCAADFDGDGDLDLISGSFGQAMGGGDLVSRFLVYYENVGSRTSPKLVERPVPYDGAAPSDILAQARAVDLNGDGLLDLAISTMSYIYIGWNTGTKTSPRWKFEVQTAAWGLAPLSLSQWIDWNHDGLPDLVRSPLDSSDAPQVQLNLGKGTHGAFGPAQPLLPKGQEIRHPQAYGDPWTYVYLVDTDGDGDLDILWADGPGNVYLHRNIGTADQPKFDTKGEKLMLTTGQPIKVGPPVVAIDQIKDFVVMQGSRAGVTAADYNEDGRIDIVVGDALGDVFYFANGGTAQKPVFEPGVKLGNISNRAIPSCYDWDHDGRRDVIGISWDARMEWYRNLGPGAKPPFAPGKPLTLPPTVMYSPRVVIADWNGDGDDDFLVMSSYPWFCWLDGSYVRHGYAKGRIIATERRESGAKASAR